MILAIQAWLPEGLSLALVIPDEVKGYSEVKEYPNRPDLVRA
jgi:hypothetical protein